MSIILWTAGFIKQFEFQLCALNFLNNSSSPAKPQGMFPPSTFISFLPPYLLPSLSLCDPRKHSERLPRFHTDLPFLLSVSLAFAQKTDSNSWNTISPDHHLFVISLFFLTCFLTNKRILSKLRVTRKASCLSMHTCFCLKLLIGSCKCGWFVISLLYCLYFVYHFASF